MAESDFDPSVVKVPEPDWIGDVLGCRIKNLRVNRLGDGRGLQSTAWRLGLEAEPADGCPATLILKSETADPMFNELSRLNNAFEREVGVYQHCTPRLKGYQPAVYASSGEAPAWLLMEDLSHLLAGDQVVGLTYEQTLSAVRNMAAIHAEFWMDSALEQYNWLPHHGLWFASPKQSVMEDFFATYGVRFGSEVTALYGAVLEQSDAINAALNQRKWTLIHGDLRADNLLFDANLGAPKSVILDWSWAARGHAAVDVAFLVGGSTPVAQRFGRYVDFVQAWHAVLIANGVENYSLDDAWYDWRLAALRCMTAGDAMHGFASSDAASTRVALFMDDAIQRHAAFALELEAWRALPDASVFAAP